VTEFDASELSLYPNPASREFTINLGDNAYDNIDLLIMNSLGQQLNRFDNAVFNGNSNTNIDVSNLATGLYFVIITLDGNSITKKLLIE